MHYLDANKTAGEETRRQLHKNAASNIEQVLEATPHKAPTIRSPTSHQENYPSQTNQTCRTQLEKQGRAHKWCTPMDPRIWPNKSRTTNSNIQQLCEDTGFSSEDLPEAMNDREKWCERVRDIRASGTTWWWWLVRCEMQSVFVIYAFTLRPLPSAACFELCNWHSAWVGVFARSARSSV